MTALPWVNTTLCRLSRLCEHACMHPHTHVYTRMPTFFPQWDPIRDACFFPQWGPIRDACDLDMDGQVSFRVFIYSIMIYI